MKLFIASDIHGSYFFCEKLMKAFDKEEADKILFLGDILYHGPRNDLPKGYNPKAVIELLNNYKEKILCVRGNCDTEVDQMVLSFPILADYCVISDEKCTIYATHGHHLENFANVAKGTVVLYGHTHVPTCEKKESILYMNPGSVSIPKENSENSYMIYEDGKFVWKNLDGEEYKELRMNNE